MLQLNLMKTALIFLSSLAVILGIFAYFAVFGPPTGSYSVSPIDSGTGTSIVSSSLLGEITSTSTSPIIVGGSPTSTDSGSATAGNGVLGSSFGTPPLIWPSGQ